MPLDGWWAVLLDGAVGAIVGALASFGAAVWVVFRQSKLDRQLRRHEMSTSTALIAAQELTRVEQALKAAGRPMKVEALHRELLDIANRIEDVAPLVGYVSMTSYLELIEIASQMRSSAISPSDRDTRYSEWKNLARRTAFDVRQIRQDIQAVATKDATSEFWAGKQSKVSDQDTAPVRDRRRLTRNRRAQ